MPGALPPDELPQAALQALVALCECIDRVVPLLQALVEVFELLASGLPMRSSHARPTKPLQFLPSFAQVSEQIA